MQSLKHRRTVEVLVSNNIVSGQTEPHTYRNLLKPSGQSFFKIILQKPGLLEDLRLISPPYIFAYKSKCLHLESKQRNMNSTG